MAGSSASVTSPLTPRLYQVRINGFKAVNRLKMEIADSFTLLIGINGAGKSSILQALGFFRYVVEGRGKAFFDERGWDPQDLRFRSNPRTRVSVFQVSALFHIAGRKVRWDVEWGLNNQTLYREMVRDRAIDESDASARTLLTFKAREGGVILDGPQLPAISITGSIIPAIGALISDAEHGPLLESLAQWASGIRSMELLSPHAMKGATRLSQNDMGIKGDRLGGFLASLSAEQKSRVVQRLARIYPIVDLTTVRKRAGWIDMQIAERYNGFGTVPASQMSDGFMRLLALCAIPELGSDVSLVLLDELEDGIEPHVLPRIVDLVLQETDAQIIATSHSPLLVNHVGSDDVRFISRNDMGVTIATTASELPAFKVGSDYFGPGEMWTSSPLEVLKSEAAEQAQQDAAEAADKTVESL